MPRSHRASHSHHATAGDSAAAASSAAVASAAPAAPAASSSTTGAAASKLKLSLLLHQAAFKNDVAELRRLLALNEYDVNAVDAMGNTALHIAVLLLHRECVDALLVAPRLKILIKNKQGFTPLHEAVSIGDRELLRQIWLACKHQAADNQELADFLTHLARVPDFKATFVWRVETWLPFISRWLPSDRITISKKGSAIRVDTNMLEFANMTWLHHPYSFLILPRPPGTASSSASHFAPGSPEAEAHAESASLQPFLVFTLDHETRQWNCVSFDAEQDEKDAKREARKAAAAEASTATAASASSSTSTASSASEIDLNYELDDFQVAPITSAFSPGRLLFKPITYTWSLSSWASMFGLGKGAPQKTERVHRWTAHIFKVENIRVHMYKRYEHLTAEEIAEIEARSSAMKNILSKPLSFKKHLEEASKEEENENEEDDEASENENSTTSASGGESIADTAAAAPKKASRTSKKSKQPVHRTSLPPPPQCPITYEEYFSARNQQAYTAVDLEEVFDKQRDEAAVKSEQGDIEVIGDAAAATAGAVDDDETLELREQQEVGPEGETLDDDAEAEDEDAASVAAAVTSSRPAIQPVPTRSHVLDAGDDTPYLHLGRPMLQRVTRKKYNARLYMAPSSEFPLQMATVLGVVELLFGSTYPQVVAKFRHFVTQELPPGFPVRITVPVLPTISIDLAIAEYEQSEGGAPIRYTANNPECCTTNEATFFAIPRDYQREEESEEQIHERQQKYRKRWKAGQAKDASSKEPSKVGSKNSRTSTDDREAQS